MTTLRAEPEEGERVAGARGRNVAAQLPPRGLLHARVAARSSARAPRWVPVINSMHER